MNRLHWTMRWLVLLLSLLVTSKALAFDLFRSRDADVERGNQRMAEQDYAGAREAYEAAVRRLPSEGAVHLNRGLAQMAAGDLEMARAAFLAATEPPADREIRSAAYYDLGLAFYRQGDAAAMGRAAAPAAAPAPAGAVPTPNPLPGAAGGMPGAPGAAEPDHREAQRLFREAADSFRRSLRLKPGNRDAAWNLELALRRIQDEEDAQREQDQQNQDQQNQDQQNQDPQNQDQQNQDPQNQDPQNQDPQNQDPQNPQNQDPQNQDPQDQDPQNQDPQNQDQQNQDQQNQDQQSPQNQDPQDPQNQDQQGPDPQDPQAPGQALPEPSRRLLDALQDGEESLQQLRARQRSGRGRPAPAQDW